MAAVVAGSIHPIHKLLLACFSGAFITIAANSINDYYDIEIDKINRPNRPLPGGLLTPGNALFFSISCFSLGIFLSFFINHTAIVISFIFSISLFFYSFIFKRTVLLGNFIVSLSTACAFIYGGLAVNRLGQSLFPALFAFLMHFGREIIKDMEDAEGDKINNAQTLPIQHGFRISKWFVTILFVVLICATLVPYLLNLYGFWYMVTVCIGVNLVLFFITWSMWTNSKKDNLGKLSALLKADMLIGLLAIYLGRF